MSERPIGEWVEWFTSDGTPNGVSLAGVGNVWTDDLLAEDVSGADVTWEAGLDEVEEAEVSLPVSQFAELLVKAKAYDALLDSVTHAGCTCTGYCY